MQVHCWQFIRAFNLLGCAEYLPVTFLCSFSGQDVESVVVVQNNATSDGEIDPTVLSGLKSRTFGSVVAIEGR